MSELLEAVRNLAARKREHGGVIGEFRYENIGPNGSVWDQLLGDCGLEHDEVADLAVDLAHTALRDLFTQFAAPPFALIAATIATAWQDGLATGVMLERGRRS